MIQNAFLVTIVNELHLILNTIFKVYSMIMLRDEKLDFTFVIFIFCLLTFDYFLNKTDFILNFENHENPSKNKKNKIHFGALKTLIEI